MKVSIVLTAIVFACALGIGLRAQGMQGDAPKEHSMTGCLAKGADAATFKLANLGQGPKEAIIAESTVNLAPHVGHKMEITGSAVQGKDPQAHTMKITAVKMISSTCP